MNRTRRAGCAADLGRLRPGPLILWHDERPFAADDLHEAAFPQLARRAPDDPGTPVVHQLAPAPASTTRSIRFA